MLIILITSVELGTYFKGHNVCKEIWNPKLGEELVRIEPNNYVDKFAVSTEKDINLFGHMTKVVMGKFAKTILFSSKWQLLELFAKLSDINIRFNIVTQIVAFEILVLLKYKIMTVKMCIP